MPRSSPYYTSVADFERSIIEKVQSTAREELESETVDKNGRRMVRARVRYFPVVEYDPPYVVEATVAEKDYRKLMIALDALHIVYDIDVHRANRGSGYRVRAKFRHPDYFMTREEMVADTVGEAVETVEIVEADED